MFACLQAVGMSQYIPQLSILLAMDWLIGADGALPSMSQCV